MHIQDCSIEELEAEIERRKKPPEISPLANPDFTKLIECVTLCVSETVAQGWEDDDNAQYVYEAALQAVYGDDVFDKLNEVIV